MNTNTHTRLLLRHRWASIVLVALLQACGGGGGGGSNPGPVAVVDADPTGYYSAGSLNVQGATGPVAATDLQGIVYNKRMMIFSKSSGFSYDGTVTITGNSFTGTVAAYTNGHTPVPISVNGTITAGTTLSGTLAGTGAGTTGTFSLNYASSNSQVANIARVDTSSGTTLDWSGKVVDATTATQASPRPSSDPLALTFNGTFIYSTDGYFAHCFPARGSIKALQLTNLYVIAGDSFDPGTALAFCSNTAINTNDYSGFATTLTTTATDDTFILMMANGTYHFYGVFRR